MSDLISYELSKEELYELAADTIEYCSDGKFYDEFGEVKGMTFETAEDTFIELSNDKNIYVHKTIENITHRTKLSPEALYTLFILFESMTDNYNDRNKE